MLRLIESLESLQRSHDLAAVERHLREGEKVSAMTLQRSHDLAAVERGRAEVSHSLVSEWLQRSHDLAAVESWSG